MRSLASLLLFFLITLLLTSDAAAQKTPDAPTTATGKVSVCKEIDDDWKCVGEASELAANTNFNVLFVNSVPVGVDFIGIVIHKQGPDGKDVDFINEYMQDMGATNRNTRPSATTSACLRAPTAFT